MMQGLTVFAGRLLLAQIFVMSGMQKVLDYAGTQGYMRSAGVSVKLLPLVIAVEVLAGLMLILGWYTRLAAVLLAGFTLLAAIFFHANLTDEMQVIQLTKNLAVAGGLLVLAGCGPGNIAIGRERRGSRGLDLDL